jgi:NAD(P)-dependent dehydrogenase (short-subunit alcohol dehydrogenase family)
MDEQQGRFAGRTALITGAASGIGRAVALRLSAEGAHVVGVDIDEGGLDATVELAEGAGGVVVPLVADLTEPSACHDAVDAAVASTGRLDVLGNVAGIVRGEHVTDVTVEQYRRMMAINVDACFFLSQAAIPHLLASPARGTIVTIASNAGLMGQAYTVVYCMSKGAVIQMTRALAMEYVKTPLRINAIAPAGVDTPLARGFVIPPDVDPALMAPYVGHRRAAKPEEIATLFAHLASDDSPSTHGAIVSVDGGVTAG